MLPFLQVLEDGGERSMREVGDLLAARFSLTESELQELLPSGQAKLFLAIRLGNSPPENVFTHSRRTRL
jgi:restriction endonuclease Mrr